MISSFDSYFIDENSQLYTKAHYTTPIIQVEALTLESGPVPDIIDIPTRVVTDAKISHQTSADADEDADY